MFDDTIEVLTYPTVVIRGKSQPDYTATPTAVSVSGVDVQPGASTELIAQRAEGTAVRWTVFDPNASAALTASAVVRFRGNVYQVDGEPQTWTGSLPHKAAALVDWQ